MSERASQLKIGLASNPTLTPNPSSAPVIPNPNPTETITLLLRVLEYLTDPASSPHAPAWQPSQIHLFGFAQGGSCAGELALAWSRQHRLREISSTTTTSSDSNSGLNGHNEQEQEQDLGSIVAVSAPLLSHPTVSRKSHTKVLLTIRRGEERMVGASSWSKGFESVQTVNLGQGGQGMLRGQSEWIEVMRSVSWQRKTTVERLRPCLEDHAAGLMSTALLSCTWPLRFWSTVLVQRSALELSAGVYEVRGGTNAARSAGAGP